MRRIGLAALAPMLALAGCVSFGPKAPAVLVTLQPAQALAAGPAREVTPANTVAVATPALAPALTTTRIPVYMGANQLAYVKDVAWNSAPSELFGRLLGGTIAARTGRAVVELAPPGGEATQLAGTLDRFGIDPARLQATVVFDAVVTRPGGRQEQRRFAAEVPVSAVEAHEAGRALNEAANVVAAQVADWVK